MAANEVIFDHGGYQAEDYVATADILGGQVLLLGNTTGLTCGIAHSPIANGATGAIAIGAGTYKCVNLNNAASYAKVWWDFSVKKLTTVSTNNALFGWITRGGGAGANTNCYARHWPYV
jgi:hypothetical protein